VNCQLSLFREALSLFREDEPALAEEKGRRHLPAA